MAAKHSVYPKEKNTSMQGADVESGLAGSNGFEACCVGRHRISIHSSVYSVPKTKKRCKRPSTKGHVQLCRVQLVRSH